MNNPKIKEALKNSPPDKSIGGQAVIEGVMMRGKKMYAIAVRSPENENEIVMIKKHISPISNKYKFLKLPVVRGVVAFVDSLITGMKIITDSAEIAMIEEDKNKSEPDKFEVFLNKIFGEKSNDILLYFSAFIAILLSIGLFMLLPTFIAGFSGKLVGENTWILSILEGFIRIFILVLYIFLISRLKDIQRVFQYHGAEHKTINCYEKSDELTVENVKNHTRLHKRCGTSFLIIVMIVSMVVFFFIRTDVIWMRFVYRILLVPVIAGFSYEIIKWAGKSDSAIVNIVSYPGMCLQKLTTAEPDESQIEVAIAALKEVLENEQE